MRNLRAVNILLRISIASVFLYAATSSFLQPQLWIWYFPQFLRNIVPDSILLTTFSIYQIILSVWLLSGKKTFYAAILASLTLLGIITANLNSLDVLFRDFAIFFTSMALAVGSYGKKKTTK